VRIEIVAGEFRKVLDIGKRDRTARGLDRVTDVQMIVVVLEWMLRCDRSRRAFGPYARQRRKPRRRCLDRRPLHVMKYAAKAAEFFAAAGASRTAMHKTRQR